MHRSWAPLAAAALLAALILAAPAGSQAPPQAPNFVVLMSDDQGPGMMRALPTVRARIERRGVTFTDALISYPLCCPSRATLLTGEYAHNHGTKGNNAASGGGYRNLLEPRRTLASWLQANGYETDFVGKWLNGLRQPRQAPPGWTNWNALVGAGGEGLSSFYDYDIFEADGTPRHFGTAPRDYQTDALTRSYALPLIDAQAATPGPFFLWMAYHPPHFGLGRNDAAGRRCSDGPPDSRAAKQAAIPPPRYARRFLHTPIPRPPSFDERDVSDKPKPVRGRPPLEASDLERIARDYRCGLAALLAVDDSIRAILDELEATGQLENTVVVFLTDNGAFGGEHRIARGKNSPYEEAIETPLAIRGPGLPAGTRVDAPVVNADLAPTILQLAGAAVPAELARPIDGVSLVPAFYGAAAGDRAIPIEGRANYARARHGYKVLSYVGVRTSRYAYVERRRATAGSVAAAEATPIGAGRTVSTELYDLSRDPYELRNRAGDSRYARPRAALTGLLAELEHCLGAECFVGASVPKPAR